MLAGLEQKAWAKFVDGGLRVTELPLNLTMVILHDIWKSMTDKQKGRYLLM